MYKEGSAIDQSYKFLSGSLSKKNFSYDGLKFMAIKENN